MTEKKISVPIRSAEKDRVASCLFADRVASLSLKAYEEMCPDELRKSYKQTVLSTILVFNMNCNALYVVSVGVGTKVLLSANTAADKSNCSGEVVRDMHAEVLAKRGFIRYLYTLLHRTASSDETDDGVILCKNCVSGKYVLKQGISIHQYTSSQPCGNASVKKWMKGRKPDVYPELSDAEFPVAVHSRLNITCRDNGQVAILVKKSSSSGSNSSIDTTITIGDVNDDHAPSLKIPRIDEKLLTFAKGMPNLTGEVLYPPPGTAIPHTGLGNTYTCSDKIARWNCLGLQGKLLMHFLESPLYLSTITVGRKFSQVIAERALCCRLQDFSYPVKKKGVDSILKVSHPAMLCTSIKFDKGSITTVDTSCVKVSDIGINADTGAHFDEKRCFCWFASTEAKTDNAAASAMILDSDTGLIHDVGSSSLVSSNSFMISFKQLLQLGLSSSVTPTIPVDCTYKDYKKLYAPEHILKAEEILFTHGLLFKDWKQQ